ncbi:MAG: hypothetical protein JWN29_1694 [Acidimicrobiales bacterium]|nr:hypothetical protein [Acidimicrobiales bacterium]
MTSQETFVETEPTEPTEATEPAEATEPDGTAYESVEEDTSVYLADLPMTSPPRPTRSVGFVTSGLLVVVVAALGFLVGVKVQQHKGGSTAGGAAAGFAARLGQRPGGAGAGAAGGGPAAAGGGATAGTVKLVDGDVIYVTSTSGDIIKVRTTSGSTITKSSTATVGDIRPGDTVVVQGQAGSDGTVAATRVTDNGAGAAGGGFGGAGGGGFGGGGGGGIAPGG